MTMTRGLRGRQDVDDLHLQSQRDHLYGVTEQINTWSKLAEKVRWIIERIDNSRIQAYQQGDSDKGHSLRLPEQQTLRWVT